MNTSEYAKELLYKFGKVAALEVVSELLKRDKQWIDKLSKDEPDKWQLSDFDKSVFIFNKVKDEINKPCT